MEIRSLGLGVAAGLLAICHLTDASATTLSAQPVPFFDTGATGFTGRLPPGPAAIAGDTLVLLQFQAGRNTAYVFVRQLGVWIEAARLTSGDPEIPSNTVGIASISAVAISPDGSTVFVGDPTAACPSAPQSPCGEVLIYKQPASGWVNTSTPDARLLPSQQLAERLGTNLAMSGDGSTLAAMAVGQTCPVPPNDPVCQAVYIYQQPAGGWSGGTQTAVLALGGSGSNDQASLALSPAGDVVSTNGNVFNKPVAGWSDTTGTSVALSNSAGFDSQLGDFGTVLSMSSDLILLGAPSINAALVYEMPPGGWVANTAAVARLSQPSSVSFFQVNGMAAIGNTAYVASDNAIYVYDKPVAGGWVNAVPDSTLSLTSHTFIVVDSPNLLFTDGSQLFAEGYSSSPCSANCDAGSVLSTNLPTIISRSGLVVAGVSVDDVTDSISRVTQGPAGGQVTFNFDVENEAPGFPGTATFTATLPGQVTAADHGCSVAGNTVSCMVSLANGQGVTLGVTSQLPVSGTSAHVSAALSTIAPASWDPVNATLDYSLPMFFEPIVPTAPTAFHGAPGASITGTAPVSYGGTSPLTFKLLSSPSGTFTFNPANGQFTWTPSDPHFMGAYSFTYFVSDGIHISRTGEVDLDETAGNSGGGGGNGGGGGFGVMEIVLLAGVWLKRGRI